MATAHVRMVRNDDPRRVQILDRFGRARWHEVWKNNPHIASLDDLGNFNRIVNAPGVRPYISGKTKEQFFWQSWPIQPGEIYLDAAERELAKRHKNMVIVEPNLKANTSPNKEWGWVRWSKFVYLALSAGIRLTQIGPAYTKILSGVDFIQTKGIRDAFAILSRARAAVLPEGALHHAAAALGIPAVVIFGGYISPEITGYQGHRNIFTGGTACGMRTPCGHCAKAMAQITPERVLDELLTILKESNESRHAML